MSSDKIKSDHFIFVCFSLREFVHVAKEKKNELKKFLLRLNKQFSKNQE